MRRKISPKFHVKNGAKNGKFHPNFTLPGRSADVFFPVPFPPSPFGQEALGGSLCGGFELKWSLVAPSLEGFSAKKGYEGTF